MMTAERRSSDNRGAKKLRRRISSADLWILLHDKDAIAGWPEGHVRAEKRRLIRLYRMVAGEPQTHYANPEEHGGFKGGLACSSTRVDDFWQRGVPYQPGSMIQCAGCGAFTPRHCIGSSGHCDDCRLGALPEWVKHSLQGSTSSVSMNRIRRSRERGENITPGGF